MSETSSTKISVASHIERLSDMAKAIDKSAPKENFICFLKEVTRLEALWKAHKILQALLRILNALCRYIGKSGEKAQDEAIVVFSETFNAFEQIVLSTQLTAAEKKALAQDVVNKYSNLRQQLSQSQPTTPTAAATDSSGGAEDTGIPNIQLVEHLDTFFDVDTNTGALDGDVVPLDFSSIEGRAPVGAVQEASKATEPPPPPSNGTGDQAQSVDVMSDLIFQKSGSESDELLLDMHLDKFKEGAKTSKKSTPESPPQSTQPSQETMDSSQMASKLDSFFDDSGTAETTDEEGVVPLSLEGDSKQQQESMLDLSQPPEEKTTPPSEPSSAASPTPQKTDTRAMESKLNSFFDSSEEGEVSNDDGVVPLSFETSDSQQNESLDISLSSQETAKQAQESSRMEEPQSPQLDTGNMESKLDSFFDGADTDKATDDGGVVPLSFEPDQQPESAGSESGPGTREESPAQSPSTELVSTHTELQQIINSGEVSNATKMLQDLLQKEEAKLPPVYMLAYRAILLAIKSSGDSGMPIQTIGNRIATLLSQLEPTAVSAPLNDSLVLATDAVLQCACETQPDEQHQQIH